MKNTNPKAGKIIRLMIIGAVAAAGAAMFIAVARTKFLPTSYLAALAGILTVLGGAIALAVGGRKRFFSHVGSFLAVLYVFTALSGCGMATQAKEAVEAAITPSPTLSPSATPAPTPTSTPEPTAEPTPEPDFPRVFTIFVSGIDSRDGLVDKSFSDVNTLFVVNRDTHQVLVVATPRDAFVPLSISDGVRDKLTHSGQHGIDVQVDTMEMLYDIDIDYWFRLDFQGFKKIIDTLGGVTVHSDYTFTAYNGTEFTEGENTLDGEKALCFARERKAFSDGDIQRGRDQFQLISAMIDKILSPDMLGNYSELLDAMEGCFETTIPYDLLADLVRTQLAESPEWNVVPFQMTGTSDYQVTYRYPDRGELYVLQLSDEDMDTAKTMMADVREGKILERP